MKPATERKNWKWELANISSNYHIATPILSKYQNYQFKLGKCQRHPPQHEKFAFSYG